MRSFVYCKQVCHCMNPTLWHVNFKQSLIHQTGLSSSWLQPHSSSWASPAWLGNKLKLKPTLAQAQKDLGYPSSALFGLGRRWYFQARLGFTSEGCGMFKLEPVGPIWTSMDQFVPICTYIDNFLQHVSHFDPFLPIQTDHKNCLCLNIASLYSKVPAGLAQLGLLTISKYRHRSAWDQNKNVYSIWAWLGLRIK